MPNLCRLFSLKPPKIPGQESKEWLQFFSFRFGITNCMNVDVSHDEHMISEVNIFYLSQVSL